MQWKPPAAAKTRCARCSAGTWRGAARSGRLYYNGEEAERVSDRLIYDPPACNEVMDFEKAKEIGLRVRFYEEFKESWSIVRRLRANTRFEAGAPPPALRKHPRRAGGKKGVSPGGGELQVLLLP